MLNYMKTSLPRKTLVSLWLLGILIGIGSLFWYQSWIYLLPTPLPPDYREVALGSTLTSELLQTRKCNKPLFLHFYNPDCACSRFNRRHFQSLVKLYQAQVDFVVVLLSQKNYSEAFIQKDLNLHLPVLHNDQLASICGVYSTPQAVLIDTNEKLFYRGNYNRSRYCSDEQTSYAKQALGRLLRQSQLGAFDELAFKAYGCKLPSCKN